MTRILVAEDQARIAAFVRKGLEAAGFTTMVVDDGTTAASVARDDNFDLMILDLGLPGLDGIEVLNRIRARGERMPVIVLTARDSIPDRVRGLEQGADDYITKPFSFEELLARVRVRLRDTGTGDVTTLNAAGVVLDIRTRRASIAGSTVELTAREYQVLEFLMRHAGQVISREQLLSHIWGYDFDPGSNVVDVYIRNLRKKLGAERIETVRNMGYRFGDR
ncbi:MAG: response regulator transcription factor [Ilumatobacter sp.]|uniref:response regulator transcription factor n=1 Tax=Ilumatobacter sp. TaxID=1967498 RepID=UPI0026238E1A|nr:response regulator transcription factor [Ilumatobacter sp.]MDJ0768967.1 response regulator transcription factor [Ilumatobacter sp.]